MRVLEPRATDIVYEDPHAEGDPVVKGREMVRQSA